MSVSDKKKQNLDGSILWYWYENTNQYAAENTNEGHEDRIRRFERWLASRGSYQHTCHWSDIDLDNVSCEQMVAPRDIDENDAEAFLKDLSNAFSGSTQNGTASALKSAYDWLESKTKPVEDDPFGYVLDVEEKDILDIPDGREAYIIPIEDARYYIRSWNRPKFSCVNQIAAKYTRRAGGISNLDLKGVNIDHPACQWSVHPDIRHWDDHILFRSDISKSDPGRKSGNKTATTAKYPLDNELKQSLLWYLAVRPEPRSPEEPLFFDTEYGRLSAKSMSDAFRKRSKEITDRDEGPKCWYGSGDGDNINPHYWRHWSTTWYEDRVGGGLVDYLRGDIGQGSKANYNQYSDMKEQQILEHMPKFFEPFIDG
jgi:hypothetical protein